MDIPGVTINNAQPFFFRSVKIFYNTSFQFVK
jgi:hypothetical protein